MNNNFNFKILNNKKVNVYGIDKKSFQMYISSLFEKVSENILIVTNTLYEATQLYDSMGYRTDVLFFPVDEYINEKYILQSPELSIIRMDTLYKIIYSKKPLIIITNVEGYKKANPSRKTVDEAILIFEEKNIYNREELLLKIQNNGYTREAIVTKTGEFALRGFILDIFPVNEERPIRIEFFDNQVETIKYFNTETQISSNKIKKINVIPFCENFESNDTTLIEYFNPKILIFYDILKENEILKKDSEKQGIKEIIIYGLNNYVDQSSIYEKYDTREVESFSGNIEKLRQFLIKQTGEDKTIIISFDCKEKIKEFVKLCDVKYVITSKEDIKEGQINLIISEFETGFQLQNCIYLSEETIFNVPKKSNYKPIYKLGKRKTDNNIEYGDYVVHINHGIGKYLGIVVITQNKLKKDYIKIQYKGNDKLYIPVDKINMIYKYSSGEGAIPQLSRLNSNQWKQQKRYVREKVQEIAKELIKISLLRKQEKGFSFLPDDDDQREFENNFEYIETEDQLKAIKDVKKDMEKEIPMDRLICGDVGYGKTEVAFRAIFKAIKSGKQATFLCPTTILSNQHYTSSKNRFKNFGINIEILNRFTSPKTKKIALEKIKTGETDLLIGTHSVLNDKIEYNDLGLLIVDEEQRFGVLQKEKIKKYKHTIDVLTLSATPIPRTMQMALVGIRNLSIIETPPINRYPIQTYVLPRNENVIKDAIYKELSRDGQVFILYNNIEKINDIVLKIKSLVPEANITCIHGQMTKKEIENNMLEFIDNKYNVLVCTTIIETGIDIKNVNTLVVLNSDYFGLSQLYQIRGRIGRSDRIAYAYLMYDEKKILSDIARKRLNAIKEFTELGSGYLIAERDLAIRGAGDILGSEQSGFINLVGYDLYLKIMNEEVEKLNGYFVENEEIDKKEALINIETHISNEYVEDEEVKIEIHKKISEINTLEDLNNIKYEIENRFGKISETLNIYMHERLFENMVKNIKVKKVIDNKNEITIVILKENIDNKSIKSIIIDLISTNSNIYIKEKKEEIKISLKLVKQEKHYIYYLIDILKVFI